MRTGRPRAFCVEQALDRAMDVFWRKGYEGSSLSDLTIAMGINAPSLYAAFGSKEGLFRAVLDHYDGARKDFMEKVLSAPTAREVAAAYLKGVIEKATDPKTPGCLLLQSGLSCSDNVIPNELARHRAQKELALKERFEVAKRAGDLPKSASSAALARYIMAVCNGMLVQAAAGATEKDLRDVARMALDAWPVEPSREMATPGAAAAKRKSRSTGRSAKDSGRTGTTVGRAL